VLKIATLGLKTFSQSLANISDDARTRFHRNLIQGARQSRFDRVDGSVSCSQDFLLQDIPDGVVHWVEIRRIRRQNVFTPKAWKHRMG